MGGRSRFASCLCAAGCCTDVNHYIYTVTVAGHAVHWQQRAVPRAAQPPGSDGHGDPEGRGLGRDAARRTGRGRRGGGRGVLRGYELHDDDAIHGVRMIRAALHGFVLLEREGGFAMPIDLQESYRRLVGMLDRGLSSRG